MKMDSFRFIHPTMLFLQDASGTEESNDAMGEASGEVQQPSDASEVPAIYLLVTAEL